MKKFIITILLVVSSASVSAQPRAYFSSKDGSLIVNGKEYRRSLITWSYPNKQIFKDVPLAQEYYDKYIIYRRLSTSLFWGGIAGSLFYTLNTKSEEYSSSNRWLIFCAGVMPSLFLAWAGRSNFLNAMNIFNGKNPELAKRNKLHLFPSIASVGKDKVAPSLQLQFVF